LLAELGVRAAVAVPLRLGAGLAGCLVVEVEEGPRVWRDGEVRALRLLGDLVGAALERRRLAQALMESCHRMERAVLFDPLTGLPNRVLLAERMRAAMAAARAGGTELAVCSLDLDGFKTLNDSLGQEVGDLLLSAVATRLREQVRESDSVARLGGDEFVLLLGGFESPFACARVLDPLLSVLGQPYQVGERALRVTASVGVTLYPRDPADADTLLRHADYAMYRAKQRGRNCYWFFNPTRDRWERARHSRLERIAVAIEHDELVLYFQPKVDMRARRVIGAEALVRWQHPEDGLVPPGAFIPLLAGTTVEQRLDAWVLGAGLRQLAEWRALGLDLALSLNISARSVQHPSFVHDLAERLACYPGFVPESLSLEILESEALVDLDAVASVMQHCAGLGVGFALDDFGTGYSSLTYFRRLPARVLKIDQTFVRDMLCSSDDRNIVEGVVGLARAFRREVIAEGVESAAHGLMLLRMGCDQAQGYGVAEPMAAGLLPDWVAGYRFPSLWNLNPDFELSGPLLDLLGVEALYRDWVAGLMRTAGPNAPVRPAVDDHGGFGTWYQDQGRRLYGGLAEFGRIEPLHLAVWRLGQDLWDARERGEPTGHLIADLISARDRCILALQALQEAVLKTGTTEGGRWA
jgi:diguanylate cyclase (GGDEF)-like protein